MTRFAAIYFTLFFLSDSMPVWTPVVAFVGRVGWGISEVPNEMTGSGDRLYDWLLIASLLATAAIAAGLWSLAAWFLAKRRGEGARNPIAFGIEVEEYLRVVLRYGLALMIIGYGFAKTSQFPAPDARELATPLGEMTPMALMWSFMGSSVPYALFSGVLEILGGFLLLFRRTTTLGALVFTVVMTNVFILNVFYDVPVKILTFHALVAGLVLVLPDVPRLLNVLVLNRATVPRTLTPSIRYRRLRPWVLGAKWLALSWYLFNNATDSVESWRSAHEPRWAIGGIWRVVSSRGAPATEWRRLAITRDPYSTGSKGRIRIESSDGTPTLASVNLERDDRITLTPPPRRAGFPPPPSVIVKQGWRFRIPDPDTLILESGSEDGPRRIELRRDESRLLLTRHRIHLIQEWPRTP